MFSFWHWHETCSLRIVHRLFVYCVRAFAWGRTPTVNSCAEIYCSHFIQLDAVIIFEKIY